MSPSLFFGCESCLNRILDIRKSVGSSNEISGCKFFISGCKFFICAVRSLFVLQMLSPRERYLVSLSKSGWDGLDQRLWIPVSAVS
jgi:hypothetical protein